MFNEMETFVIVIGIILICIFTAEILSDKHA